MEEHIFPDKPANKLHTENAIRVATFLGGPLVAGYLIADNYKQLGETDKVKITWLISVVATIAVFVIAYFLPAKTPRPLLPIAYSLGVYYLVQNLQGPKIKTHIAAGGQMYSIWNAVVAGIIGLIIIVAIIVAAFYFLDQSFA